jgi:phosphoribosylformimino-5-aminoimidazole carboxamide ribotide isomerase
MNGVVVRGIAGRRSEYRPIVSQLTTSTEPVQVARALIEACHPRELYVADLDAIQGDRPSVQMYREILGLGVDLWVDAGIRCAESARRISDAGCHVVAGLETVPNPEVLREIVSVIGPTRVVFSLDLQNGAPMRGWGVNALSVAAMAVDCGVQLLIVLDLARVGVGRGAGTEDLCREIASRFSRLEVIAGGGVSGVEDLNRLAAGGVRGVLVASALHDKRLPVPSTEY